MNIEPLELRIAPAALFTYTDVDGDMVTVTSSKGTTSQLMAAATIVGGQLQTLTLGPVFAGAAISIMARTPPGETADGFVNVGRINAPGLDLASVTVDGDLGAIDAGNSLTNAPAVGRLVLGSLGRLDAATGAPDNISNINGRIGSLVVKTDIKTAQLLVTDAAAAGNARIGPVMIGGSMLTADLSATDGIGAVSIKGEMRGSEIVTDGRLASARVGGSLILSGDGRIFAQDGIGMVSIGGNIEGGRVSSFGPIGSVFVGGSLIGGGEIDGGQISASGSHLLGAVTIRGDVEGGSALRTGRIFGGSIGSVIIGGSLLGGTEDAAGSIDSNTRTGSVRIGVDVRGGNAPAGGVLIESGFIGSDGRVGSVMIGGSLISGTTGDFTRCAAIVAGDDIGAITVKGSLLGNLNHPVEIRAEGQPGFPTTTDIAIRSITVGGRVEFADILAGYDRGGTGRNPDAQIGRVTVGADWIASNLVAGVEPGGDGQFATGDDSLIGAGAPIGFEPIARISSIVIKGQVQGTLSTISGTDHFGFVAEHIVMLKIGGTTWPLVPGPNSPGDFDLIGPTNDVRVREVLVT